MTPITDNVLTRYVSGDCTAFEQAQVDRWLGESPERRKFLLALREIASDTAEVSAERKAAMLAAIKRSTVGAPIAPPTALRTRAVDLPLPEGNAQRRFVLSGRSRWSMPLRAVAAVAILALGIAVGRTVLRSHAPVVATSASGLRTFGTTPGQRLSVRLPDGTAVTLAPASLLRLPVDYGIRTRTVELQGEATFTVTHDPARPFAVSTSRGSMRDLGTHFAVRAYPDDPAAEVVVAEGRVAVIPAAGGTGAAAAGADSVVLSRGEYARIDADGKLAVHRDVALDPYFAWTAGRLVFRDTPLRVAAARMSRWYDIDVRVGSPAAGDRLLTAAFDEGAAADVLPLVAASLKLELTQSGRIYTFRVK